MKAVSTAAFSRLPSMILMLFVLLSACEMSPLHGADKKNNKSKIGKNDTNTFIELRGILQTPENPDEKLAKLQKNVEALRKLCASNKKAFDAFTEIGAEYYICLERTTFIGSQGAGFQFLAPYLIFPGKSEQSYFVNGKICTLNPSIKSVVKLDRYFSRLSEKLRANLSGTLPELEDQLKRQREESDSILARLNDAQLIQTQITTTAQGSVKTSTQSSATLSLVSQLTREYKDAKRMLKDTQEEYDLLKSSCEFTGEFLDLIKKQYELYGLSAPEPAP